MKIFSLPPCQKHCKLTVEILYFYRSVHAHRARLIGLFEFLQTEVPDIFSPWREESHLIKSYLYLHDLPKIQKLSTLKEYGYSSGHTLCCRLGQFFGKNRSQLGPMELDLLETAIFDLNAVERRQKDQLISDAAAFWSEDKRVRFDKFIAWVERVVDVTDTELSRSEEFGRRPAFFGATQFLERRGEAEAAKLSFQLESKLQSSLDFADRIKIH